MPRFTRKVDFASLGLLDLIQARDMHPVKLANTDNLLGSQPPEDTADNAYIVDDQQRQ